MSTALLEPEPQTTEPTIGPMPVSRISAKAVEMIVTRIPPERIVAKLDQMLDATRKTKNGVDIDTRAVETAVRLWLAYAVGLPVQRTESVNVNLDADSSVGITDRLARSPALRDQLRKALAEADAAAGVVDVPAVEHA
jgi:hypothetical protein